MARQLQRWSHIDKDHGHFPDWSRNKQQWQRSKLSGNPYTQIRITIWWAFCTLVTSVIIRDSPPDEQSIFSNEKSLNLLKMARRRFWQNQPMHRRHNNRPKPHPQRRRERHRPAWATVKQNIVHVSLLNTLGPKTRHDKGNGILKHDFKAMNKEAKIGLLEFFWSRN